jgi:hypothetical protein
LHSVLVVEVLVSQDSITLQVRQAQVEAVSRRRSQASTRFTPVVVVVAPWTQLPVQEAKAVAAREPPHQLQRQVEPILVEVEAVVAVPLDFLDPAALEDPE